MMLLLGLGLGRLLLLLRLLRIPCLLLLLLLVRAGVCRCPGGLLVIDRSRRGAAVGLLLGLGRGRLRGGVGHRLLLLLLLLRECRLLRGASTSRLIPFRRAERTGGSLK